MMLTLFTCSPSLFSLLFQLIIFDSLLINWINFVWDALCHVLVLLSCFTVFGSCRVVPWPGLWSEWVRQLHHLYPFLGQEKIRLKHKPRIRCCCSLYFTCPSFKLVKALEAASFWHWAWWPWWSRIEVHKLVLAFSLFFWGGGGIHFTQGSVHSYAGSDQPFFFYCKVNHCTRICSDWLSSIVSMSDYIATLQFFSLFYFTSLASGLLSQGSIGLPRKPNISTAIQKSPSPTHTLFMYDFLLFSKSVQKAISCLPI